MLTIWWSVASLLVPAFAAAIKRTDTVTIAVNPEQVYQIVDGFGASEAFGRAENVFGSAGLSPSNTQRLLDLLYSLDDGAGFTILRNGIGSANASDTANMLSIEPVSPGTPSATPQYVPNNNTGQLPLAQQAYQRGLQTLYADAWSAPGYMKTNDDDNNGGYLCGVSGTDCATGNWMQAYANYLIEYVRLYKQAGATVTNIGFLNEPQYNTTYASMLSNGTQAAEFIRVLAKTIKASGFDLEINCCDSIGWLDQEAMMPALEAGPDPATNYLSVITGHGYDSPPNFPLSTTLRSWLTEWADLTGDYFPHTFFQDGGPGEGMTWAANIQIAFAQANVSAFLYWEGAENATASSSLINLANNEIITSKRYWALAQFSKFVRPGARRIEAVSSGAPLVNVTSFQNSNGVVATQVLNNATTDCTVEVKLGGWQEGPMIQPYLTNNQYDLEALQPIWLGANGTFECILPARSMVSFVTGGK